MKFKLTLAITFALVFVFAFIMPSVSAGWIFGNITTGDNKEIGDGLKLPTCSGTVSGNIGSFNTIQKCGNSNENLIFNSPVLFNQNASGQNLYLKNNLNITNNNLSEMIYNISASSSTGLRVRSYLGRGDRQLTIGNQTLTSNDNFVLGVDESGVFRISRDVNDSLVNYLKMNPNTGETIFAGPVVASSSLNVGTNLQTGGSVFVHDNLDVLGEVYVNQGLYAYNFGAGAYNGEPSLIISNDENYYGIPGLALFKSPVIVENELNVNGNLTVDQNSSIKVVGLSGQGTAYACLTADGTLYRSNSACR